MHTLSALLLVALAAPAATAETRSLVVGMGSFLRARNVLGALPGVSSVELGYAGGFAPNPSYGDVRQGKTGHAEVVLVNFDPNTISAQQVLEAFFKNHDYTQRLRQGVRVGTQYRSLLCWRTEDERRLLSDVLREFSAASKTEVTTELAECEHFWPAEPNVQQLLLEADQRTGTPQIPGEEVSTPSVCKSGAVDIVVRTKRLRVCLLPEFSAESVSYVQEVVRAGKRNCHKDMCQFYRCEKGFLLQGRMKPAGVSVNAVKGPCPPGVKRDPSRVCPAHDPSCGCHGPIMEPGMVGWAGGSAGPDFFIYAGNEPAVHWSHDHTVWGKLATEEDFVVLKDLLRMPVHRLSPENSMKMLNTPLPFKVVPVQ